MGDTKARAADFIDRLRRGLTKLDAGPIAMVEPEVQAALRRSLEISIAGLESGQSFSRFRFRNAGGKALLFQNTEALPLDHGSDCGHLNPIWVKLQSGESLDLDGSMAAIISRPEVNQTDSIVRQAEEQVRVLRSNRENKDHAAIQAADSNRIRLR